MSKNHKPHYVPWKSRKWIFCKHPDRDCTAMGYSGICHWNSSLDICEYGQILAPEEIRVGVIWRNLYDMGEIYSKGGDAQCRGLKTQRH